MQMWFPSKAPLHYVTDGPEMFRTKDGHLLMLWSSYDRGSYVETCARSKSGELAGPWEQLEPLVKNDSGHGMLFYSFEGQLMMVLHHPFNRARGKIYEMKDCGDHLEVVREPRGFGSSGRNNRRVIASCGFYSGGSSHAWL